MKSKTRYASRLHTMRHAKTLRAIFATIATIQISTFGQSSRPEYGIKFDAPEPGSFIRREAVRGSKIPINRNYSELTDAERNIVNSWYEHVGASDEPPFPIAGLKPILDALRRAQEKLLVTGELFLIAKVNSNGEDRKSTRLNSSHVVTSRMPSSA